MLGIPKETTLFTATVKWRFLTEIKFKILQLLLHQYIA